jgi:hypothetical protein
MAMASKQFLRHLSGFGRRSALVFAAAIALTPALTILPASASVSGNGHPFAAATSVAAIAAAEPKCTPEAQASVRDDGDNDNGDNDDNQNDDNDDNQCPPPVVPEAPLAVLLPLSAGAVFSVVYFVYRRRSDSPAA